MTEPGGFNRAITSRYEGVNCLTDHSAMCPRAHVLARIRVDQRTRACPTSRACAKTCSATFTFSRPIFEWIVGSIGNLIADAIKQPLLLGLGASLYLGWLSKLITERIAPFDERVSLKLSAGITAIAIVWAISRLGHAALLTKRVEKWLQLDDPKDRAMAIHFLKRSYTILMLLSAVGALMLAFGVPPTALAALSGGAGVGLAFGTQKIAQNFFSGFMLFFNRPFKEGDWISTNNVEGTVETIGWYHTRLRTFERRPMYIPNAMFATNTIISPGQMYNRRIKANIGLRYEDIDKMNAITEQIRAML